MFKNTKCFCESHKMFSSMIFKDLIYKIIQPMNYILLQISQI